MKWREPPGRGIDPGPAPRLHPGPTTILEGCPARCHNPWLPQGAMVGVVDPVAVAVQVLPTGHARRHVAGSHWRVVGALIPGNPVGKGIPVDTGPGIAGTPGAVEPQIGTPVGGHQQRAVARLETQFAPPGRGLGGVAHAVDPVVTRALRQPAALAGGQFQRPECVTVDGGQAQCHGTRLDHQQHRLVVDLLEPQLGVGAQTHGGAAQPKLGAAVGPGSQAVARADRPVSQGLGLGGRQPLAAIAVEPAHITLQGTELADKDWRLVGRRRTGPGSAGGRQAQQAKQAGQQEPQPVGRAVDHRCTGTGHGHGLRHPPWAA